MIDRSTRKKKLRETEINVSVEVLVARQSSTELYLIYVLNEEYNVCKHASNKILLMHEEKVNRFIYL
jgi:hypothetical protein